MSRDTRKRLFNCEQDNKAETSTDSCPTNKLYYERKGKTQRVQNSLREQYGTKVYRAQGRSPHVLAISNATRERWYFNVQSKVDTSQLNLPHGTNNQKSRKQKN